MRIARFAKDDSQPQYAFVQRGEKDHRDYLVVLDGYPFGRNEVQPTGERIFIDEGNIRLLAPVIPSKIYGFDNAYGGDCTSHNPSSSEKTKRNEANKSDKKYDFSHIFLEASTVIGGNDDPIPFPKWAQHIYCGPQIGIVIAAITRDVSPIEALKRILGYVCVNDIVADAKTSVTSGTSDNNDIKSIVSSACNDIRLRNFDASTPIGPWIQTDMPENISFHVTVNGETRDQIFQDTDNFSDNIAHQISLISQFSTLLPGDIILTGTPVDLDSKTALLQPRDEVIVRVEGIGDLRNIVI